MDSKLYFFKYYISPARATYDLQKLNKPQACRSGQAYLSVLFITSSSCPRPLCQGQGPVLFSSCSAPVVRADISLGGCRVPASACSHLLAVPSPLMTSRSVGFATSFLFLFCGGLLGYQLRYENKLRVGGPTRY